MGSPLLKIQKLKKHALSENRPREILRRYFSPKRYNNFKKRWFWGKNIEKSGQKFKILKLPDDSFKSQTETLTPLFEIRASSRGPSTIIDSIHEKSCRRFFDPDRGWDFPVVDERLDPTTSVSPAEGEVVVAIKIKERGYSGSKTPQDIFWELDI